MTANPPTRVMGRALSVPVPAWHLQSAVVARQPGGVISRVDYRPDGWLDAPARSTVLAAVLADGQYPDVFRSTALRDHVDPGRFRVPWWYRLLFAISGGGRTLLRLTGVMHRAELWVNGVQVAGPDEIAGAYAVSTFDVTDLVVPGVNAMAVKVLPGHPTTDLSIGWIDWNPTPPDANMGLWRDVEVQRTGDVHLMDPYVVATLSPGLDLAELRVGMRIDSAAEGERAVTITGSICRVDDAAVARAAGGSPPERRFATTLTVSRGRRDLLLTAADLPELAIAEPAVWWPVGHGSQPLYELRLVASIDGDVSDQAVVVFGVRGVTSHLVQGGGRQFVVNGRPVQIRGAGWCPDIFLRHDRQKLIDQLSYVVDLGLNTIRLEGKLENPEFFEIADRLGILVLPGWECCTKWEAHAGTGAAAWTEQDQVIARRCMASEARLLRNHPCVIGFLIGSDFAPPPALAEAYVAELRAADWSMPIISSGASAWNNPPGVADGDEPRDTGATEVVGPSGMKMWPYDWVPPGYWYDERFGAAAGFDSECSAGHSIPRMPSLAKMLSPVELDQLWKNPDAHQFHSAPSAPFDTIAIFHAALAGRYGAVRSLRDFLRKAQLANYEVVRAQFEAYGGRAGAAKPATGVIYWMLTSAWPSLNWQLFDYYLDPSGAYFGAKKANEPVHVQLTYDTGEVLVVNHTPDAAGPFTARVVVRRIDGEEAAVTQWRIEAVPGGGSVAAGAAPVPDGISPTYFVEITLQGAGGCISRNVYWMSTRPDVLDWDHTTWQYTPQRQYADLTGLQEIPTAVVEITAVTAPAADGRPVTGGFVTAGSGPGGSGPGGSGTAAAGPAAAVTAGPARPAGIAGIPGEVVEPAEVTTVTVRNRSATPAVGIHLSLVSPDGSAPVAPIRWQDNDITLFGGQRATVTARYSRAGLPVRPLVQVDGFNVIEQVCRPEPDRRARGSAR